MNRHLALHHDVGNNFLLRRRTVDKWILLRFPLVHYKDRKVIPPVDLASMWHSAHAGNSRATGGKLWESVENLQLRRHDANQIAGPRDDYQD